MSAGGERKHRPGERAGTASAGEEVSLADLGRDDLLSRGNGARCLAPGALDPEQEAFVEWFCAYWRERGARLFAERLQGQEDGDGDR